MIPPLADKQHISVMVDLSGIYEGSNSNTMLRFGLLPTIVSPPGLCPNFTRFLKVMIGKIVSHTRKTSYNNLPNLVLRLNLPNPINFHFGNISGEQRVQVHPVRGYLVRLAQPQPISGDGGTVSWFHSLLLGHSVAFCPSEAGAAGPAHGIWINSLNSWREAVFMGLLLCVHTGVSSWYIFPRLQTSIMAGATRVIS